MKGPSPLATLAAAAAGALTAYYFDPEQGRTRRAIARDKLYGRFSHLDEAARIAAIDLRNRLQGSVGALRQRVVNEEVSDEVLVERMRSRLGRVVAHPGSIEVSAASGEVTLQGPVLAREHPRLIRAIARVPGVRGVVDRLEVHNQAGNIPGLQGGASRREERPDIAQESWAPGTRLAAGVGGAFLTLYGLSRRSIIAPLYFLGGIALLARVTTNMDMQRMLGQRGHRGVDLTKTITIQAPTAEVFEFWRNFENFPRFMRNVRRVRKNNDETWHWEVAGPLGTSLSWNAAVTQMVPNERIAWSTAPGSSVQHAGIVRFQEENGGTRVQVEMTYNPPAGALGHVIASFFGSDPRTEMDEDLMRLKALFETGKPARDAAQQERSAATQ